MVQEFPAPLILYPNSSAPKLLISIFLSVFQKHSKRQSKSHQFRCRCGQPYTIHTKIEHRRDLHIQPKGQYLRAFHKGTWDKLPLRYEEILRFATMEGLTLSGYSYEKGINETVIDRIEDYIVQIEIPILK